MKQYVLGIDFGTTSVRVGIFDLNGNEIIFKDETYELITTIPGFAEQRPDDWWTSLCKASRRAIDESAVRPEDIVGIGTDATSSTLVFMDENMKPLMNAIMWMDLRGAEQAKQIAKCNHSILKYSGYVNVSPEWMPCKTLWVKEKMPDIYKKAKIIFESNDWLGYRLTGRIAKNMNDATARWFYNNREGGWQIDFFESIGLGDVMGKIPADVLKLGDRLGTLTKEAAKAMGLAEGIPVSVGGADAYVGLLALGVVRPGQSAFITGSSHLLAFLVDSELHSNCISGSFPDAVIQGLEMVEAGQASTGSIINWYKNSICADYARQAKDSGKNIYDLLNRDAEKIPIGSNGLICLDYFQGIRSPYTDGEARGLISGLRLSHTPAHIYRALIESICYGTEVIFRNLREIGVEIKEVNACGGALKSRFWLQTHANVSNIQINIPKVTEAPTLGSAIQGAVVCGYYKDLVTASDHMVTFVDKIEPDPECYEQYKYYVDKYAALYPILKNWMHDIEQHEMKNSFIN